MLNNQTGLPNAPIEHKVAVGTITGLVTLALTWLVFNFVPGVKHLPDTLQTSLPGFISVLAFFISAWLAKHEPRLDEVLQVALQHLGSLGLSANVMGSGQKTKNVSGGQATAVASTGITLSSGGGTDVTAPGGGGGGVSETSFKPDQPEQLDPYASTDQQPSIWSKPEISAADLGAEPPPAEPDEFASIWG